ncbi:MAG: hypothetical protein JNM10_01055, partial [Planctomycetia bacterium]|nr:hypothetical protein [Planctomycetia bacterium]
MTAVVVLAVAMGVIGLAAREGRRASRPGTPTADRPAADRWTPVVAVVAAG